MTDAVFKFSANQSKRLAFGVDTLFSTLVFFLLFWCEWYDACLGANDFAPVVFLIWCGSGGGGSVGVVLVACCVAVVLDRIS